MKPNFENVRTDSARIDSEKLAGWLATLEMGETYTGREDCWNAVRTRLQAGETNVSNHFAGRGEAIRMSMAGLVSGIPILLMGPPGTAKSAIVRQIARQFGVTDENYFEYLLTNHTMPEEVFGGIDFEALTRDHKFKRNTKGKLPRAEIAFLDEVFRGGSHILNTLLTIINERQYDCGDGPKDVPLLGLIGASNFGPAEEALEAFFDRFPIRVWVRPLLEGGQFPAQQWTKATGPQQLLKKSMRLAEESLTHQRDAPSPPTCTNDLRFARYYIHSQMAITWAGDPSKSQRYMEFVTNFFTLQEGIGSLHISDRAFGQLWNLACTLDLLSGRGLGEGSSTVTPGVYEVFRHVARSSEGAGRCRRVIETRSSEGEYLGQ